MSPVHPLPTREAILVHGFPEGFIDHHCQQARIDRARAIGAFLAAAFMRALSRRRERAGIGNPYRETRAA